MSRVTRRTIVRGVRHVKPDDIDSRVNEPVRHFRRVSGGPECGISWFCAWLLVSSLVSAWWSGSGTLRRRARVSMVEGEVKMK